MSKASRQAESSRGGRKPRPERALAASEKAIAGKPGKQAARRRAAEDRILEAFGQVLLQQGAGGLGVNAVAAESGISKGLIYYYFGGLEGLADAWMARNQLAPTCEEIAGEPLEDFARRDKLDRLARIHVNYASLLRQRPAACEILAASLVAGGELPAPLDALRLRLGKAHEDLLTADDEFMNETDLAKIFVLQAASNYLALRAQSAPDYNGVRLDTESGWNQTMEMLCRVAYGQASIEPPTKT